MKNKVLVLILVAGWCGLAGAGTYDAWLTNMSDLVSYWNLNEASGTTAADAVTGDAVDGDNPGTYSNTAGVTVGQAGPRPTDGFLGFASGNNAPEFLGSSDAELRMATYLPYAGKTDLTMVVWMWIDANARRCVGGLQQNTVSNRYVFSVGHYENANPTNGLQSFVKRSNEIILSQSRTPITFGEWHMWVMTFENGNKADSYLDGVWVDGVEDTNPAGLYTPEALLFGIDIDKSREWKGGIDEIAIFDRVLTATEIATLWDIAVNPMQPHTPTPADGAVNVGTPVAGTTAEVQLGWKPGRDPVDPQLPYSEIRKYYLYMSADQTISSDPNLIYVGEIDAGDPIDPDPGYGPVELNLDGEYLWRVDTGVALGGGGVSLPDDPATIVGKVWGFTMLPSDPVITDQPDDVVVDTGATAIFSITVESATAEAYQWYKYVDGVNDTELVDGGDISGAETDTLSIANADGTDEGYYYCHVVNVGGGEATSELASLGVRRMIAHWTLDGPVGGQYPDETGVYPADPNGTVSSVPGLIGNAVSLDGTGYLTVGDLPGLGFEFTNTCTVAAWIKSTTTKDDWLGIVTKGDICWRLQCYGDDDRGAFHVDTPSYVALADGTVDVIDDAWHLLVGTFDGATGAIYIDGLLNDSDTLPASEPIYQTSDSVWIGGHSNFPGDRNWEGLLDDVRLYNYVLT
ncbi:MAG: immunoglobulin domain-containing protein, partial [Sedimentisphaerales bacterium]|nr:immunoglobulin domain-containing protein [Sedimentisphaerales bacterium]